MSSLIQEIASKDESYFSDAPHRIRQVDCIGDKHVEVGLQ